MLTDTSPRMVKCRFFSLSMTASPSSGEKVGEELHSTERRERPQVTAWSWRGDRLPGLAAGSQGQQLQGTMGSTRGKAGEVGGTAWRAVVLLNEPHQTGSAPSKDGSGAGNGENSPRSQNIGFKWVRGTEAAGQQSPTACRGKQTLACRGAHKRPP